MMARVIVLLKCLCLVDGLCVPSETAREAHSNVRAILDKEGKYQKFTMHTRFPLEAHDHEIIPHEIKIP